MEQVKKEDTQQLAEQQEDTKAAQTTNAISNPLSSYPAEKQTAIRSYIQSVDAKIKSFVQNVKNGDLTFKRQKISDVSARAATDIGRLLGVDVSGYTHNINTNGVKHILTRHGENGKQDKTMAADDDIARVGWVLENYDKVELLTDDGGQVYSAEFLDKNHEPSPQIRFTKKIDGSYYVVEAAFENDYKKLWVQSAYLQKNGDVTQTPAEGTSASHKDYAQSESASPSPRVIIDQGGGVVNTNNQNGGNVNASTYGQAGADGTGTGAGVLYGGGQRNVGTGTGESAGSMVGGTESATQRTERLTGASRIKAAIARQNLARSLRLQKVSSQEIGLTKGTETRSLQVLPQENWDSELQALAQKAKEETGKEAVFVVGEIYVKGADGKNHRVRAAITDGNVILQADYSKTPLEQLLDHEIYHYKNAEVREDGHNLDNMNKLAILEQFSQEEYMAVLDAYMAALDGQYGLSEAKQLSTDDKYKRIVALIRQEMMADAYAGINAFGAGADKFTKVVRTRTEQLKPGKNTAQENGTRQTNGPNAEQSGEEKYSSAGAFSEEAKAFAEDVQQWNKNGRDIAAPAFILGSTGEVLQGLGAVESDIYMLPEKINRILEDHPEMTPEIIQKIPQILEDPILILKSRNVGGGKHQNTRLVIFGAVKATDGRPVMAVLDLRPVENNLVIDDMQKVNSAYTKDVEPIDFVQKSDVLHADKKRTTPLLRTIGFKMPIELQHSGSVGSISYQGQNVKLWGEKFADVVKVGEPTQKNSKEKWVSWKNFSPAEMVRAQMEGRYDNETRMVRVDTDEHYSTDDEGVEVIKSDKKYELDEEEYRRVKAEMTAKERQWRENFLNNELGEKGAERYRDLPNSIRESGVTCRPMAPGRPTGQIPKRLRMIHSFSLRK